MKRFTAAAAGSVLVVSVMAMPAAGAFGDAAATHPKGARGPVMQVDTTADGVSGDGAAGDAAAEFSPDGSRVVFMSEATNLVPGDTNGAADIFVRDLTTGAVARVSTTSTGQQADRSSWSAAWSPNGRSIAFTSDARNLVPGDTNRLRDIFVKNLATGSTTRVSTTSRGDQALPDPAIRSTYWTGSTEPTWSPSGRWIAFTSGAYNLVAHDTNSKKWCTDVFVKNLATGQVQRVSTSRRGRQANGSSAGPQWSPDGKQVMFDSAATNLVRKRYAGGIFLKTLASGAITRVASGYGAVFAPNGKRIAYGDKRPLKRGDKQRYRNVYVKQLRTGREQRLSDAVRGDPAEVGAYDPAWSPDGRGVAFASEGTIAIRGRLDYRYYPVVVFKTLKSGAVTLLSAKAGGEPIVGWSETVGWSPNGKRIVFRSWADNIPPHDFASGNFHVYVKTLR